MFVHDGLKLQSVEVHAYFVAIFHTKSSIITHAGQLSGKHLRRTYL